MESRPYVARDFIAPGMINYLASLPSIPPPQPVGPEQASRALHVNESTRFILRQAECNTSPQSITQTGTRAETKPEPKPIVLTEDQEGRLGLLHEQFPLAPEADLRRLFGAIIDCQKSKGNHQKLFRKLALEYHPDHTPQNRPGVHHEVSRALLELYDLTGKTFVEI